MRSNGLAGTYMLLLKALFGLSLKTHSNAALWGKKTENFRLESSDLLRTQNRKELSIKTKRGRQRDRQKKLKNDNCLIGGDM